MQVLRWSAAAALAAMVAMTPSYANDELSAMKASMENMKIEMDAMRATMEAQRATAGGAPEALQSAKGNASIRIGGDVRVQYGIGWGNGYGRANGAIYNAGTGKMEVFNTDANYKSTVAGWDVARAEIKFDIDLSCDTSAQVALRFDGNGAFDSAANILDQAWWKWDNVGGTGFGLKIGLQDMPFGMWANTDMGGYDFAGVDRALITDPFVRASTGPFINGFDMLNDYNGNFTTADVSTLGLVASYNWNDEVVLKAGIMSSFVNGNGEKGVWAADNSGYTYYNENRNLNFVDHVIALGYNPCWIEGLHLEMSYLGRFDGGKGDFSGILHNTNPYAVNRAFFSSHNNTYTPSFDLGAVYKINDQWKVYAEGVLTWNEYYADGFAWSFTSGVDYRFTEKLMFGAGFEYAHRSVRDYTVVSYDTDAASVAYTNYGEAYADAYRLTLGAKYDFGNGLYFQAQYYHDIFAGNKGFATEDLKDADVILFQTGFQF